MLNCTCLRCASPEVRYVSHEISAVGQTYAINKQGRTCCQVDVSGWLEAFAAHPRIGDVEALRSKFASERCV